MLRELNCGDRLRLSGNGAGAGLSHLVLVPIVGVSGGIVEHVRVLRQVAGTVALELRGLAFGVGHGLG